MRLSKGQKWWLLGIVFILLMVIVLASTWFDDDAQQYITVPVLRGNIENTITASGALEAKNQIAVSVPIAGKVKKIHVVLGQHVRKGQLLAELDPTTQKNSLLKQQAILSASLIKKRAEQIRLDDAKQKFSRQKLLIQSGATSQEELENASAKLAEAELNIALQNSMIQQARLDIESARLNLHETHIIAPMSGIVAGIFVKEGTFLATNSQGLPNAFLIAQLGVMTVKAKVSEADVLHLKKRQPVYFSILGMPNQNFHARLLDIGLYPQNESDTHQGGVYYDIAFDVPNPQHVLRIGMTAQVSIVLKQAKDVLFIPSLALGKKDRNGCYMVQVLGKDGKLQHRRVKIGLNNHLNAQVLEGLKLNEQIVIGQEKVEEKTSSSVRLHM